MISQPASAKPTAQPANVRKAPIADLDLTREGDAAILVRRVDRAARAVCTGAYDDWRQVLAGGGWYRDCVRQASRRAVGSLDNPMVNAMYEDGRAPVRLAANDPRP